jgi:uncharacterized protein YfkK (UPF0435 family)
MKNKMKLVVDGDVFLIRENPDVVNAKRGWVSKETEKGIKDAHVNDRKEKNRHLTFYDGAPYAFGYKPNGDMAISKRNGVHYVIGNRKMACSGRLWLDKAIISFWKYPKNRSTLKTVLHDLEKAFNEYHLNVTGDRISPDRDGKFYIVTPSGDRIEVLTRAKEAGVKLNFHGGWLLDVPAKDIKYDKNVGGRDYEDVENENGVDAYLYSLAAVFSGMRLSGPWGKTNKKGKEIDADLDVDDGREHVNSPLLKAKNAGKLDAKGLRDLYDYMKMKDKMTPDEVRMYNMIARRTMIKQKETYKIPMDPKDFEHWYQNTFEGIEAYEQNGFIYIRENSKDPFTAVNFCGILWEAPHIVVGNKAVDLEFEAYDKVDALKRIIRAAMKEEITDKYGSKFRLTSDNEVSEFIKKIMKNPQVRRMVD